LLGGCGSVGGDISLLATVSGGENIRVPIKRGGVPSTVEDGLKVDAAGFTLNADKKVVYMFDLSDARGRALQSVRIEDVSDAAPVLLVEDAKAVWTNGHWRTTSRPFEASEPVLSWMSTITNTLRVFRITLTFADGKTRVLHQGAMYPNFVKAAVRRTWGENY
jgi:hypothetical protein